MAPEPPELERILPVLEEAERILDEAEIPHAVFGGIAATYYGRPHPVKDVDFLVRPEDADRALEAFDEAGWRTEKDNPRWLYKTWKDDVLVDVIFKVKGDVYFDDEMVSHVSAVDYADLKIHVVSAEDALVLEAVSQESETPDHWYNALAMISAQQMDWGYVRSRARVSPRRVLSLLVYAQSTDLIVPDDVVKDLFRSIYG